MFHRYGVPSTTVQGPRSCPCQTTGPSTSTTVHLCDVITIVTSSSDSSLNLSSIQKKNCCFFKTPHLGVFLITHCFVCVKLKGKCTDNETKLFMLKCQKNNYVEVLLHMINCEIECYVEKTMSSIKRFPLTFLNLYEIRHCDVIFFYMYKIWLMKWI